VLHQIMNSSTLYIVFDHPDGGRTAGI
jgi:hypothetical protein